MVKNQNEQPAGSAIAGRRDYNETELRILEAAIDCLKQWGIDKTSLNDIAKQAKVTRPTVYSYFPARNDVIRAALLHSGYEFADRLHEFINRFDTPEDRLVETLVYALEELPKEPYLAIITQADLSSYINQDALNDPEGLEICLGLFREILDGVAMDDATLFEITELTTRIMLSFLMIQGPLKRTPDELREFLKRRLLPIVMS